ncbi:MAG: alcohol dehydrogenase catalytic domain-containing protein [Sedimentisphaerales bacterium]|nr:alcohol dehydrogenase catalytic domain-containing protein [Sedimentisphaerales bacterium]
MKAMFLTALRQMELRDAPEPVIEKDTDVLLKIESAGVCGSDVHYFETGRIGSQVVEFPFVVGHECSASVVKTGSAVKRVKAGDQVVVEPSFACHDCDQCNIGREHTCRNVIFLGTPKQMGGCLCEYIVIPQGNCFPTYGEITLEQGALCEPLSIGIYSVQQSDFAKGSNIAILGSGPIGMCVLAASKEKEHGNIYITDKIDSRLSAAQKLGVDYIGNPDKVDIVGDINKAEPLGLDCVFECCGQQDALDQAMDILKPGGQLVIVGIPRTDLISFSADKFRRKEITIKYIRRQNHCVQKAIDFIKSGKIDIDFLITHRFELEQTQDAFELLTEYGDGVIKAMVNF